MKRFTKRFEDMMAASAFAEAGDFKTAQEILKEGRRILLAIKEGHLDKKILKYALNTCKRVAANLDILYISSTNEMAPMLKEFLMEFEKEGIDYSLIRKEGCLEKEIKKYTDSHDEIVFVIIESPDNLLDENNKIENKVLSEFLWNLKCPLVEVMKNY
jgi:hypothetical protein